MNRSEVLDAETENLLWQLSSLRSRTGGRPIDDELIERYQRGELSDTEGRRLERRLAREDASMERMAGLAGRHAAPSSAAGVSFERWIQEHGAQAHPIELRLLPPC